MAGTGKHPVAPEPRNWVDIGFKVLTILILPLLGVGLSMWGEQTLTKERISVIQRDQAGFNTQLDAMNSRINQIALTVQDTNGQIRELRAVMDLIKTQVAHRDTLREGGGR